MSRSTLRLTLECNNRCVFCGQEGLADAAARSLEELEGALASLRERSDAVTFTGGEPTLSPALPRLLARARELGFREIGLQTNCQDIHVPKDIDAYVAAGLTDVQLSLHGPRALIHDYHTDVEGSFATIVRVAGALGERGVRLVAATVVTRSNFRELAPMPALLRRLGVRAWLLRVPRIAGRAARRLDSTTPRLGMAMPRVLHAVELARRVGLPAFLEGAPLCLTGPYASRVIVGDGARAFAASCDGCEARARCPGFDPRYLARFHGDEAAPWSVRDRVYIHVSPREESLRGLFTGIGELAIEPTEVPSSEAKRSPSLTVLSG